MALEITNTNFEELIMGDKLVVVDFWAGYCVPCHRIAPVISELAEDYEGKAIIGKMDVEHEGNDDIVVKYGIRSIPTILFFKGGEMLDSHVGGTTKAVLDEKIKALL